MSISFWQQRAKEPELHCDTAVVGAGIVGSSTAFWISQLEPEHRIALIDARSVAGGASGRNAGFLLQGVRSDFAKDSAEFGEERARRLWRFTLENRDLIFERLDGSEFELESSGSVIAAGSEDENERLAASAVFLGKSGTECVHYTADETNRRLTSHGFFGSLYVPSGAMLNPVALVHHIARRSGAVIFEHAPVSGVETSSGGVRIDTERRDVRADRLVLTMNAWLPALFPLLRRYVRPVRAQMVAYSPVLPRWLNVPVYSHDGYYYARQTRHGNLLVGGARQLHEASEIGYDESVTPAVQDDIAAYVNARFPRARGVPIVTRWSGIMGFSPDGLPVIGDLPDVPGGIWAAGFTGHGMGFGFRFGRLMAELALGRPMPDAYDLFTADRFRSEGPGRLAVS